MFSTRYVHTVFGEAEKRLGYEFGIPGMAKMHQDGSTRKISKLVTWCQAHGQRPGSSTMLQQRTAFFSAVRSLSLVKRTPLACSFCPFSRVLPSWGFEFSSLSCHLHLMWFWFRRMFVHVQTSVPSLLDMSQEGKKKGRIQFPVSVPVHRCRFVSRSLSGHRWSDGWFEHVGSLWIFMWWFQWCVFCRDFSGFWWLCKASESYGGDKARC